ncbi:MAG: chemotaxis protein CheX [Planctomycetota bacterium]|jgi:CheY-specific phosphatase CheX
MTAKFFGQFLLERGRINREQLIVGVELQKHVNVKLGTLAVDRGYMKIEDVDRVNRKQRTVDKKFGELAVEEGLLTNAQVEELLANQKQDRLFLGEALVKKEFLTFEELAAELEAFRKDQESTPGTITELYAGIPNATVFETFADMATKMFLRIADETVKAAPCHQDAKAAALHDFSIHQSFQGGFQGTLCLSLSKDVLLRIAGKMLGEEVREADEEAQDGGGEFVNILSGNVCAKLSLMGKPSEILPPIVHDNRGGSPFDLAKASEGGRVVVTPLLHPEGGIELCLIDRSS